MLGNLLYRRVELRARDPGELGEYYGSVWGFDVEESRGVWSVRAGGTELVFAPATDDTDPFYHFAFNIPEHRFVDAKQWLSQRGPLLTDSDSGADDREFTTWDAHGCYVSDPARNIVELIARHTRPYEYDDPFTVAAIEGVSEVGLAVPDQREAAEFLESQLGLARYRDSTFALGDERGLVLLPEIGYPWIPERTQEAAMFPVHVELEGLAVCAGRVELPGTGHIIESR